MTNIFKNVLLGRFDSTDDEIMYTVNGGYPAHQCTTKKRLMDWVGYINRHELSDRLVLPNLVPKSLYPSVLNKGVNDLNGNVLTKVNMCQVITWHIVAGSVHLLDLGDGVYQLVCDVNCSNNVETLTGICFDISLYGNVFININVVFEELYYLVGYLKD